LAYGKVFDKFREISQVTTDKVCSEAVQGFTQKKRIARND
jgi:hypothetical protein